MALCRLLKQSVPQLASLLSTMYTQPSDGDQRRHNAVLVVQALRHLGLTFSLDCDDILQPDAMYMVLLLRYLRFMLPQLAKAPTQVKMFGRLGQILRGTFNLSNPLDQPCTFTLVHFGLEAFELPAQVTVAPRSASAVPVCMLARHQQHCMTTAFYVGACEDSAHQIIVPLVLEADVLVRPGTTAMTLTTRCYELQRGDLLVRNPHSEPMRLQVQLLELTEDRVEERDPGGAYPAFWSPTSTMTVPPTASALLPLNFLPTRLGVHQLAVLLTDVTRGTQTCLGVTGHSEQPEALACLKSYNDLKRPHLGEIRVPHVNEARREALSLISRATSRLNNMQAFSPPCAEREAQPVTLSVSVVGCPHASAPSTVVLMPGTPPDKDAGGGVVPLTFQPVAPGTYAFDVTLTGPEDIRVYHVEADVVESINARLQAKTDVGEITELSAVITNVCRSPHDYSVQLTGHRAFVLKSPAAFTLEGSQEGSVEVLFQSGDEGVYHATLVVTDVKAKCHSRYSLHGTVERARSNSRRARLGRSGSNSPRAPGTPPDSPSRLNKLGPSKMLTVPFGVAGENERDRRLDAAQGAADGSGSYGSHGLSSNVDDVITLPASGNKRIGFRLTSQSHHASRCRSWVEPEGVVTVEPAQAALPPMDQQGQMFVVKCSHLEAAAFLASTVEGPHATVVVQVSRGKRGWGGSGEITDR